MTRLEALTLAQLNPQDASTVSSGTTWYQSAWSWITRQLEGFASSIVGQILIVAVLAAVTALAIAFASPFIATALLIGFAALTLGNIAIATYENYAVKGQSFGQALWSGIVDGSVVGTLFESFFNHDLATLTYQGNTWQERLGSSGMALAQLAAARYGVKFGKAMAGRIQKTCFAAGTPIRLETGFKPIENIRAGDRVLCRDEHDPEGAAVVREVEDAFERVSPILRLTIAGQEIRTTGEHPFFMPGRGWIMAGRLRAGDTVASLSGEPLIVDGVVDNGEVVTVYNFRVKEYHTYFVGRDDWGFAIWVHNTNGHEQAGHSEVAIKDLKPLEHAAHTKPRPSLQKLTDQELLQAARSPADGRGIIINTKSGKVVDGNGRVLELQRRAADPKSSITPEMKVPTTTYTPDNSMFWDM